MATNELQARITADISGLESGLKKAQKLQSDYAKSISKTQNEIAQNIQISKGYERAIEQLNNELKDGTISQKQYQKQLQRLQRDEKETAVDTANLRKELNRLKRDQKDLATSTSGVSKGMGQVGKSTANATPSVIEFSRVIQDAPYGIQGVANNVQQLTTNFGYLRKQAGGTIPALKAFAGSFLGPAGIVFAVSTITSLLVTYGDELFNSANKTEDLEKKVDSLTDAFDAELRISEAIEESLTLQGKSTEDILNQRKGLINAQIQGLSNLLEEQKQLLEIKKLENERVDNLEILTQTFKGIFKAGIALAKLQFNFVSDQTIKLANDLLGIEIDRSKFQAASAKDKEEERQIQISYNNLVAQQKELENDILSIDKTKLDAKKKSSEELSKQQKILDSITKDIEEAALGEEAAQNLYDANQIAKELGSTAKDLSSLGGLDFDPQQGIPETIKELEKVEELILSISKSFPDIDVSGLGAFNSEQLTAYINQLNRAKETTQLFSNAASSAFSAFGQSIAQSFQTGNAALDAFIGSLINGLTQMLTQMAQAQAQKALMAKTDIAIDQAKSTSNAIVVGSETAAASGPAAAFLLPALIAGAIAVIGSAFGGIKFASGGIVPGGSFQGDKVPALLNSGEMILNAGQQANLFDILNGSLGSLQGQSANSDIVGEVVLRGQNQLIQLKRSERKSKRYYNS